MDGQCLSEQPQTPRRLSEALQAADALKKVADNMIAATESFRQHLQQQFGSPGVLEMQPPFLLSRASSSSSVNSTKHLVAACPAMEGVSPRTESGCSPRTEDPMPRPLRLSQRASKAKRFSKLHQSIPPLAELPGSIPFMLDAAHVLPDDVVKALNLSSPTLPARLQTPMTPLPRQASTRLQPESARPSSLMYELPGSSESGLAEHSGPPGDYFSPLGFDYTAIRPDCDSGPTPPATSSSSNTAISKEIRRKPVPPPSQALRPVSFPRSTKALVLAVVCLAHALTAASFAQAMLPAETIGESFSSKSLNHLHWYTAAYALGAGAFSLPATRVAAIFGYKIIFICGLCWLCLWSLLAGLGIYLPDGAAASAYFCFCRAMQGSAAATVVPTGHVILRLVHPPSIRDDVVMGIYGVSTPLGFVMGAVFAGLLSGSRTWPWIFFLMSILSISMATMSFLVIPSADTNNSKRPGKESLWVRLDALGVVLSVAGLALFSIGWNQVPIATWGSPYTYFLMVIGAILIATFLYLEIRAPYPLIPVRVLAGPACLVLAIVASCWAAFGIWTWYLVLLLERLRDWSPLLSSAALIPLAVSGVTASFATSYILEDRTRARWLMFASSAALFIGAVFMATAPPAQTFWLNTFFSVILVALGIVMVSPAAMVLLGEYTAVADMSQGLPAGLTFGVAMYAMSTALGMAGAVEKAAQKAGDGSVLAGYRGAQYFGLGLTALGMLLASVLVVMSFARRLRKDPELGTKL